jgi:hypothetical protein
MSSTLSLDTYQLTTLVSHFDAGRLAATTGSRWRSSFASCRATGVSCSPAGCGRRSHTLRRCASTPPISRLCGRTRCSGPRSPRAPGSWQQLERLDGFDGARSTRCPRARPHSPARPCAPTARPSAVLDTPVTVYTPLAQARTDLLRAKLIETPFLSSVQPRLHGGLEGRTRRDRGGRGPVLEFGQRRTHREAAVDATYAAWVAGCAGSSNLRAWQTHGIPAVGTMDHFAIQAAEAPGVPVTETEWPHSPRSTRRSRRRARCSSTRTTPCAG